MPLDAFCESHTFLSKYGLLGVTNAETIQPIELRDVRDDELKSFLKFLYPLSAPPKSQSRKVLI